MSDFFDLGDLHPDFVDVDGNGIPDIYEEQFINTTGAPVPDAINGDIDRDGDELPDQHDGHIDLDGNGLDYRVWTDSNGDGMNDWVDPFSPIPGQGLSPEIRHQLNIEHINPFYR